MSSVKRRLYWEALTITALLSNSPGTIAELNTDGTFAGRKARMPVGSVICGNIILGSASSDLVCNSLAWTVANSPSEQTL
jgi:hypothetical protein